MAVIGKLGLLVTGFGVAHFVAPEAFKGVAQIAFPHDTEQWVLRNGASEVAIGLAMAVPKTRKLGVLALLGYGGWFGYNAANSQD